MLLSRTAAAVVFGQRPPQFQFLQFTRSITSRHFRKEPLAASRPKPWPYQIKSYTNIDCYLDRPGTRHRFDENTKVICVEGPPAVGKSAFAQAIAEDLEMKYFPMVTLDMMYINCYGFDMRSLDSQMPESMKTFDDARFLREPKHYQAILYQMHKLLMKTSQYFDAMAHVFNTGEGVVLDRCVYSDFVFAEAMYKVGYISKQEYNSYNKIFKKVQEICIKPHVVIYLDASVGTVREKMAQRKVEGEMNTITEPFLECLEEQYKLKFLRDIESHAELLVYDWTEPGNAEAVVEDIERIDFDAIEVDPHNPKMEDWRFLKEWDANEKRWEFTEMKPEIINKVFADTTLLQIPAFYAPHDDMKKRLEILYAQKDSGYQYAPGFNQKEGEGSYFWRLNEPRKWKGIGTVEKYI